MDELRTILAVALFATGCYLVYDMIAHGFSAYVLLGDILSFWLVHHLLPKRSQRQDSATGFIDYLDLLLDLPYKAVALLLRSVGSLLNKGPDIDL